MGEHAAVVARAKAAMQEVLYKAETMTEDEAVVELFLSTRSVARLLNAAYNRLRVDRRI